LNANTTSQYRDTVRQQLRHLRECWEKFIERITVAERTVEEASTSWAAFNKQCDELEEWLDAVHSKLSAAIPQNTLQEKKHRLQFVKVVFCGIFLLEFLVYFVGEVEK